MSFEDLSGEPDHYKTAVDPSRYLPTLDSLVANPNELIGIVRSPDEEALRISQDALLNGDDLPPQVAFDHVDLVRRDALTSILAPEAKAQLATGTEATTRAEVEQYARPTVERLNEVIEGPEAQTQAEALRELNDEVALALSAASGLEDMLHDRLSLRDPSSMAGRLSQLSRFAERYKSVYRKLSAGQQVKGANASVAKVTHAELVERLDQVERQYFVAKEELSQDPAHALDDQTVDGIVKRGASSVDEHQAGCDEEVNQSERAQRETKAKTSDIEDPIVGVVTNLAQGKADIEDLVAPGRLAETVTDVSRFIRSIEDGGERSVRYAQISAVEAKRLLSDMRNKLTDAGERNSTADMLAKEAITRLDDLTVFVS